MFEYQLTPLRIEKCKCGHECCSSYYVVDKNSHPLTCDGRLKKDIAQLFAAAPELLNACKDVLAEHEGFCKTCGKNCDECSANKVMKQVTDAIVKAEGRV